MLGAYSEPSFSFGKSGKWLVRFRSRWLRNQCHLHIDKDQHSAKSIFLKRKAKSIFSSGQAVWQDFD